MLVANELKFLRALGCLSMARNLHSTVESTSPRVVNTLKFLRALGCLGVARNLHSTVESTSPRVVGTLEFYQHVRIQLQ